jgi:uncharacterized membrane protein YphA (DoxX/SURF4 family)
MTKKGLPAALSLLRWVLGLVILAESLRFAFSHAAARAFAGTGLPDFIRLALALAEIVAALLFLIPRATRVGGWSLIVVLAFAVLLHLLHAWYDVGALVVYAAATWAVMAAKLWPISNEEPT